MKGLILAGGTGCRLRPFTYSQPKQLLPVAGRPVLAYGLDALREAGIHEIGVVVGGVGAETIRAAVGDGSDFDVTVEYLVQDEPRGLAHGVKVASAYLGDDDFLMYLGDNIVGSGVTQVVDQFRQNRPAAQIMLSKVADPRQFGVAELAADGSVAEVAEKPLLPRSDLAIVGIYAFTPLVHDVIAGLAPSARGELEITDALARLVGDGCRVGATVSTDYWRDVGTVPDVLEANDYVLDRLDGSELGEVDSSSCVTGAVVGPGAQVVRSRITGPVVLGARTVVRDSTIGPYTAIGEECTVDDSEIERSVILPGARVEHVRHLEHSLLGRDSHVTSSGRQQHRLVLGDDGSIDLA